MTCRVRPRRTREQTASPRRRLFARTDRGRGQTASISSARRRDRADRRARRAGSSPGRAGPGSGARVSHAESDGRQEQGGELPLSSADLAGDRQVRRSTAASRSRSTPTSSSASWRHRCAGTSNAIGGPPTPVVVPVNPDAIPASISDRSFGPESSGRQRHHHGEQHRRDDEHGEHGARTATPRTYAPIYDPGEPSDECDALYIRPLVRCGRRSTQATVNVIGRMQMRIAAGMKSGSTKRQHGGGDHPDADADRRLHRGADVDGEEARERLRRATSPALSGLSGASVRRRGVRRPLMLRVPAGELLADLGPRARPETRQVGGDLDGRSAGDKGAARSASGHDRMTVIPNRSCTRTAPRAHRRNSRSPRCGRWAVPAGRSELVEVGTERPGEL